MSAMCTTVCGQRRCPRHRRWALANVVCGHSGSTEKANGESGQLWPRARDWIGCAFSFGGGRERGRVVRQDIDMESRAIEAGFNWVSKSCLDEGRILTYRNVEFLGDARAILVRAGRPYIGASTGQSADVGAAIRQSRQSHLRGLGE